jgi:hypothetical protein
MDDDGSRSLSFEEFRKGLHDYNVTVDPQVCAMVSGGCSLC